MNVFVTGANGQLGHDTVNELIRRGHRVIGSDRADRYAGTPNGTAERLEDYAQLDITDGSAVQRTIEACRPDAVIHCAAWTAVDAAEEPENRGRVFAVNAEGTGHIARTAKRVGAKLLFISSDYVFDGHGERPWQPEDACSPLNVYGESKLAGERAVAEILERYYIVRTAWLFGLNGENFIKTMIGAGKKHDTVRVVNDQVGTPIYTFDLARLLADMAESERYGCYHAVNQGGYVSRYDLCVECYRQYGLNTRVIPVSTAEYGASKAVRPLNSRLDQSKLTEAGFQLLPSWQDAVGRYLKEAKL